MSASMGSSIIQSRSWYEDSLCRYKTLYFCVSFTAISGGRECVNLRAQQFSILDKIVSLNVWVRYFVWNFKVHFEIPYKIAYPYIEKMCILLTSENLRATRSTNSCFWTPHPPAFEQTPLTWRAMVISYHVLETLCYRLIFLVKNMLPTVSPNIR